MFTILFRRIYFEDCLSNQGKASSSFSIYAVLITSLLSDNLMFRHNNHYWHLIITVFLMSFFFLGMNYAALFFFHWTFWTKLFSFRTKRKNFQKSIQKSLTNRLLYIFWKIQSSKFLLQRLTLSFCNCPLWAKKKKGLQNTKWKTKGCRYISQFT